jgi:hypothetical protein
MGSGLRQCGKIFDLSIGLQSRLEAFEPTLLVGSHQARIARHIGGEDRGKTAGRGHGCGSPPCIGSSFGAIIHRNSRRDMRIESRKSG